MTVLENIRYGLKFENINKKEANNIAQDMLKIVKLENYETKKHNWTFLNTK